MGEVWPVLKRVVAENAREYVGIYALAVLCLLAVAAATAAIPWVMPPLIDQVFYEQRFDLVPWICLAVIGVFAVRGAASYGQTVLLGRIGNNLVARYQKRIFDHLMRLGLAFYGSERSGRLAAQINENVLGIRDMLSMTLRAIASDAVMLLALVGAMVSLDPVLSVIAVLIGPPLIYAVNAIMRRLRQVAREAVEVNARLVGTMQEATQGIAVVKAFTMEDQLSAKMGTLIADAEARANKIVRVSERVTPISEILAGFAVAGVIAYAAWRVTVDGTPPGSVFGFITALLLAYDPARRLARVQVSLERSLVNARMIYELLDSDPGERDRKGAPTLRVAGGEVRFEDVVFAYQPGHPVLNGISFVAVMIGLFGVSGAGKSTLLALLERFHVPTSGTVRIDGQDIQTVSRASLRAAIAYVSQQPYLFEGTVRDNIRYGRPDATDAEVEEAARLAQADQFVRLLPQGYDTPMGENGATLSGGQRQRLSIARAILRDAPILLLDEATSALDTESEAAVQKALQAAMEGRTTIVIAHRLSTVVDADRIVVLEAGYVVEEGTHAELLADAAGVYARFHRTQGRNPAAGTGRSEENTP
ncbi:MAG TPA: ABC transporter ATP-binding protein [Aquamicrobium sp.]|nr:ABC transporter ATP-binding protein [Aquamicrobium sp.]